jgi:hypothetical protein
MITSEEIAQLRSRYVSFPSRPACGMCGGAMSVNDTAGEKTIYACYRSTARKYSKDWWEHVEQSKTTKNSGGDPLVMKLIEEFERMSGGQNPV